ncbi:hypothetical protein [Limnohabitans sp.]|uniref:hypothetical protein n=1 Tax=Limnohabitans sp. TaxID=1907725 RepID=UPI00286F17C7|nr:hypothetical protein [Limnohabitans sp.]
MYAFTHTPRAPEVSQSYSDQRWFTGLNKQQRVETTIRKARPANQSLAVVRFAYVNSAELGLRFDIGVASGSIDVLLPASELRELAHRLLDAAHDIDVNPAPQDKGNSEGETV